MKNDGFKNGFGLKDLNQKTEFLIKARIYT